MYIVIFPTYFIIRVLRYLWTNLCLLQCVILFLNIVRLTEDVTKNPQSSIYIYISIQMQGKCKSNEMK